MARVSKAVYAAYKGDTFLAVGTVKELSKSLGMREHAIYKHAGAEGQKLRAKRKKKDKCLYIFRLEDD